MEPGPPKGHDREEGPVHHRDAHIPQAVPHVTEDDLAQLIFDLKGLRAQEAQDLVHGGIGGVQDKTAAVLRAVRQPDPVMVRPSLDPGDPAPALERDPAQPPQLLQEVGLQDLGVIGVFLRQERPVAHPRLEVPVHRHLLAPYPHRLAELMELLRICPGEVRRCGVDLLEVLMDTEPVVLVEPPEVSGRLDGRGIRAGIMVPHMYPGLVDVGGPHKGLIVRLQDQDLLAAPAA